MSKVKIPLRLKISLLSIMLAAVPLVVVAPLVLRYTGERIERINREWQISLASGVARVARSHMNRARSDLQTLGHVLTDTSMEEEQAIQVAGGLLTRSDVLDNVSIYDAEGEYIDTLRVGNAVLSFSRNQGTPVSRSLGTQVRAQAVANRFQATQLMKTNAEPRVLAVVPLLVADKPTGFLASAVSLGPLQDTLAETSSMHLEEEGEVANRLFVVDNTLRSLAHANPEKANTLTSYKGHPVLKPLRQRIAQGRTTPPMSMEYYDGGENMVGTAVVLPSLKWAVVVQVPQSIAYRTVAVIKKYVSITVILAVVVALAVGFWTTRQITRPLSRLVDFAHDLANAGSIVGLRFVLKMSWRRWGKR